MVNPNPHTTRLAPDRLALGLLVAGPLAIALSGCASHVRGGWGCALDPGMVCASISDIDHRPAPSAAAANAAPGPVIEGAVAASLLSPAGWSAGALAGAPVREPDPILKIVVAPWIDAAGDFHGVAEVFAVMRRGGWFVTPTPTPRRLDLSPTPVAADPPAAPTTPLRARP
jgi:conjugal transfer pilus assembly protein TraV